MAFGEAVFAKPLDLAETAFGEILLIALGQHAADEALAKRMDRAGFPKRGEGAAQPVGLQRAEPGADDGDLHRLFLKKGHAQGLAQHLAQFIRGEGHLLLAPAAAEIGVHHVALDRAGADDGHLDDQIVEFARAHARQEIHLRPAFHLKHPHRIRVAQHVVNDRVFGRQGRQRIAGSVMALDQVEGLADAGQHAQRQHIHLQDAERVDIVLIPFDDGAVLHRRVLNRAEFIQPPLGHDEAAHMLGQVAGESR